jgi:hypothetical protein
MLELCWNSSAYDRYSCRAPGGPGSINQGTVLEAGFELTLFYFGSTRGRGASSIDDGRTARRFSRISRTWQKKGVLAQVSNELLHSPHLGCILYAECGAFHDERVCW